LGGMDADARIVVHAEGVEVEGDEEAKEDIWKERVRRTG